MFGRTKVAMIVAEFFGAAALAYVWLAVSRSGLGFALFIAAALGVVYGVLSLTVGSASTGQYNPAVTLGLWSVRKMQTLESIVAVGAQMLGGLAAGALFVYLTDQRLTDLALGKFDWRVFAAEAVGAFIVALGATAALTQGYKGVRFAATAGSSLFLGVLVAGTASNGLLNPAVALAARSWSTAYAVGPLVGALVGVNLYVWLFAPADARPKLQLLKVVKPKAKVTKTKTAPAAKKSKAVAKKVAKPAAKKVAKKSAKKTTRKK